MAVLGIGTAQALGFSLLVVFSFLLTAVVKTPEGNVVGF
jgi:hypothetical protein